MLTKSYPIPNSKESIALQFERGYNNVHIYYRKRLVTVVDNVQQIKNGFVYHDDELGKIELNLSEKPISINVLFDGVHSPINASNPAKLLSDCSKVFYVLAILATIGTFLDLVLSKEVLTYLTTLAIIFVVVYHFSFTAIYYVSAYHSSKGKAWAYFLGFYSFIFATILFIVLNYLRGFSIAIFIHLAVRIAIILMLRSYYKDALGVLRAGNTQVRVNNELLDL